MSEWPSGSQKHSNCTVSIYHHTMYNYLEEVDILYALFLDLARTFDCTDLTVLETRVERYDFRGPALNLSHIF